MANFSAKGLMYFRRRELAKTYFQTLAPLRHVKLAPHEIPSTTIRRARSQMVGHSCQRHTTGKWLSCLCTFQKVHTWPFYSVSRKSERHTQVSSMTMQKIPWPTSDDIYGYIYTATPPRIISLNNCCLSSRFLASTLSIWFGWLSTTSAPALH